jgi:hypothetical protein
MEVVYLYMAREYDDAQRIGRRQRVSEIEYGDINVQGRRSNLQEGYRRIREEVLKMLSRTLRVSEIRQDG